MLLGGKYEFAEPDDVAELADLQTSSWPGSTSSSTTPPATPRARSPSGRRTASRDISEVMFSGDLLFAGSIGRTDLPGGDHPTMLRSLRDKVLPLADDIVVLPGHGEQTSIGRERATNPFLLDLLGDTEPSSAPPEVSDMAKPTPLSGFPELLPAQRFVEQEVDRPRCAARSSCTASPASRRGRSSRWTSCSARARPPRRSTSCAGSRRRRRRSDAGMGLHFDLTVPFARYVLENAGKLEFPFRRYQIQRAWRGERPQEGRYREFTQADIDVVMRDELPFHFDVEVARVMAEALSGLPLPPLRLRVNNRKLIEGFYRGLGAEDPAGVITVIDKLDKMSREAVRDLLTRRRGPLRRAGRPLPGARGRSRPRTPPSPSGSARSGSPTSCWRGIGELAAVIDGCASANTDRFQVVASLSLARGLDYYTGTVFEIYMDGFENLKSVGGGGRYDALASDGKTTYPGVGISFGISRTVVPLINRGVLSADRPVPARRPGRPDRRGLPRRQRRASPSGCAARGMPAEVAAAAQKFGKQIRYAERRGIPYVWFPGADGAPPGQGHPQRRPGRRRPGHLDPARRGPAPARGLDRHAPAAPPPRSNLVIRTHDAGSLAPSTSDRP